MKALIFLIVPAVFVTSFRSHGLRSRVMRWKAHLNAASIKAEWEDESLESSRLSGSRRKLNSAFVADLVRRQLVDNDSFLPHGNLIHVLRTTLFFLPGHDNWNVDY